MSAHRHAWIDASAGVAGDMLLGALLDAGAGLGAVRAAVQAVSGGSVRVSAREVARAGLRALKVDVEALVAEPPERTWRDVRDLLDRAALPAPVHRNATAIFQRLAEAEAHVHGVTADEVHFHEVGALDAIADVVGCCAALHDLGIASVSAGPVALGSGSVRTRHGRLPVPAPAVAELARGWQVSAGGDGELATPTGMALLRTLAGACEPLPPMVLDAVGMGAGGRDPADHANVVRVLLGSPAPTAGSPAQTAGGGPARTAGETAQTAGSPAQTAGSPAQTAGSPAQTAGGPARDAGETLVLLEANVDDLDPRLWPGVLDGLLELGAADAWLTPILMKKGRPAHTLSVLCAPERAGALRERIFRDTSTLGIRHSPRGRVALERGFVQVTVGEGRVAVKVGHRDGVVVQVMPEFADVAALAREQNRPERLVLQEAMAAAAADGLVVGTAIPERLGA